MKKSILFALVLVAFMAVSCTKPAGYGDMSVKVGYSVNGEALVIDSLGYTNEAGNTYLITEVQWFISKLELKNEQGEWMGLEHREVDNLFSSPTNRIFYIDTNIPESQTLEIAPIPVGTYKALRFTFGLDEEYNRSGLFSDPPEANMFWPELLGGGYHYMKLNGKYLNEEGQLSPLAIHLGIGQNEEYTEFYQNYFSVELPIDFTVSANAEKQLDVMMVIDNWFRNPNCIDFNALGGGIMQNQDAQQALKENGIDVFRMGQSDKNDMDKEKVKQLAEKFNDWMSKAAPQPHFWSKENLKNRHQKIKL